MDEIEWGAPPPPKPSGGRHGQGRTQSFVDALKARPGEWAKYPKPLRSTSAYRRNFRDVEWTSRKRADGKFDVWGRWVGESQP